MKKISFALLPMLASLSMGAVAATQGTLGTTSQGDFIINATIDDLVQVSRLNDVDLGTYTGTGDLTGSEAFCVYRNSAGTYNVTLTGSGAAGAFTLAETGGTTLPYAVTYTDGVVPAPISMLPGAANNVTGFTPNSTALDCGNADNATIDITIIAADLQAANSGNYTGTLNILVAPD